jgi:UDP-GlcNAc:undecaprenyl-phosphate GlcNAc-1-phosphate transferase
MKNISPDIFFTFYIIGIFVVSLVLYRLFIFFSHSFGVREYQKLEINRWNPNYKPSVGGFVFYIIYLFTMIFSTIVFGISSEEKIKVIGLWGTSTIAFFMGFADDTFNTQPLVKFISQVSCALVLILSGIQIHLFENDLLNLFLTIFWTVGMMNSINMLDNMDGISASIGLYIIWFVLIVLYNLNVNIFSIQFLILSGISISLLAFLFFNFYPSKIFMGDTGSQFLGLILAYAGIEFIWNIQTPINVSVHTVLYHFLIIALVFIIPLSDTTTVTINRILAGSSPMVGGKDHTTHFLCKRGLSERMVFYLFAIISFVSLFLAYQLIFNYSNIIFYISILIAVIFFLSLYLNTKLFWSEKK